jgi:cysteine sulfinate desulfinase/cysteine desulfurase-like protein
MKRVYLDHAATTPIDLRVQKKMISVMKHVYGNPSSLTYHWH